MKKNLKKITILLITFQLIISCNNKKETEFVKTTLTNNYKVDLPSGFQKTDEGMWEFPEHTYLNIGVIKGNVKDIKAEVETEAKVHETQENFKGQVFIKTESFDKNGFKGVISFYEKDNKGKGLGLVSLKSYIVYAVVQDKYNRIYLNSLSLNRNINDDLTKSIKSISLNNSSIVENKFDEATSIKNGFQIFKKENFIIKCLGKLKIDNERIKQFKENNSGQNSTPFIAKKDNTDFVINVTDNSALYSGINGEKLKKYHSEDMDTYAENLKSVGIAYQRGKFKDYDCVYYENTQNKILTKAVFFEVGINAYLLQVASNKNTNKIFEEFINTFDIIEK